MSEQHPTRNVELLERVMQHIDDHPYRHRQELYVSACGTAACFAGWACLLEGWEVESAWPARVSLKGSTEQSVPLLAEKLLGLTEDEADVLFEDNNTRDMLRLMVKDLTNCDDLRDAEVYAKEANQ